MKLIDKTPLQDDKGNISFVARVQGTLKYGLNWSAELEAQKTVIAQLDRQLEKGFILIRNFTLPNSEIVLGIPAYWSPPPNSAALIDCSVTAARKAALNKLSVVKIVPVIRRAVRSSTSTESIDMDKSSWDLGG